MEPRCARPYSRKAEHACGMNKKEDMLVNRGHFEDETPLNAFVLG